MTETRSYHGLVATEEPSAVYAFGGLGSVDDGRGGKTVGYLDTVEVMNTTTGEWRKTDIKLKEGKRLFGSTSISRSVLGCCIALFE